MSTSARRRLMRDFKVCRMWKTYSRCTPSFSRESRPPSTVISRADSESLCIAYADRSSSRRLCVPHRRQCHDLVLIPPPMQIHTRHRPLTKFSSKERCYHRACRHTIRGRHFPTRHAIRGAVPQQATRCQIHQSDVPPQRLWHRGVVFGYFAEPMESNL